MLELKSKTIDRPNPSKGARRLVRNLIFGGATLVWSLAAPAAPVINSFSYTFRAPMTNGLDADARGTVSGSLTRRGATDNQRLTIKVTKLDSATTYHLFGFLDDTTNGTAVSDFTTTRQGGSSVVYVKSSRPGKHPLPAVIDPITELRELDIVNGDGAGALGVDLRDPTSFSYSVRRAMDNTGVVAGAGGVLRLTGSPRKTTASVAATGLTPLTSYQLVVNGVGSTTKTSNRQGKLNITGPKIGLPLVLDIREVALADSTGATILVATGLGIPSIVSTAGPAPVALGSANGFAVLAGSTVTSTGGTTVNGDLGVSPGTAVTGFPPGTVHGAVHAGDAAAAQAQLDLTIAYNDAAGRTVAPITVAGNLGGQTLAPGLYKSTSSLEISSGDLTLDAQGDANAVFIFQIASTLTTTSGRQVILSGGAQPANIFWQVGSSATLGTASVFKGTIMANQSITLTTGATLDGRALARIAAVTLDANTIRLTTAADTTAPSVSSTDPANAASGVALNKKIAATFSEAMNASTISTTNFTLKQGATAVAGTVTYTGTTATFAPTVALASNTTYTATITTGVKDLAGNAMANAFAWSFTTGASADTTAPFVSSADPANAATGVALNKKIAATFSEAMDPSTISTVTFTLKQGTTPVAGTVSYAAVGTTATFEPGSILAASTVYTATITTGAKDLAGNSLLSDTAWSFTTGATADTNRPTVLATVPANAATGVGTNQAINLTFSEQMDPATISTATFLLTGPGPTNVTGTVAYNVGSKIATFTPAGSLAANTVYGATVTTVAKDLAGNALATNVAWSFTTAATTAGQAPVVLASATAFAVLSGSTVTSIGGTTVTGDLGVSPGTAVTGFGPGVVNGTIHAGDPASAQAQLDLTTAYNDAAGRTLAPVSVAGNLGGQTLAPGLYKSTSSLEISSGDLTLDAQGNANAVFIFQMASTLTTTAGRQVILSGGAKAANIFWQVGSSATLGSTSVFKGTVMADQSITLTTGATLEGRALARIGAVSLDSNAVTLPAP
jgi:hypothetical protein